MKCEECMFFAFENGIPSCLIDGDALKHNLEHCNYFKQKEIIFYGRGYKNWREIYIKLEESVFNNNFLTYHEIGYQKGQRDNGIKPYRYLAYKMVYESLDDDGWGDYIWSSRDKEWLLFDRDDEIWRISNQEGLILIVNDLWNKHLHFAKISDNSEEKVCRIIKKHAVINTEKNQTIYNTDYHDKIPFKNGVYIPSIQKIKPNKKSHFFTTRIPFPYRKKTEEPKKFNKFLNDILPDENKELYKEIIYGFIGSLLRGYNIEQWMLWLIGKEGGTGKGSFCTILKEIMGTAENYCEIDLDSIEKDPHTRSQLIGKRLILCSETDSTPLQEFKTMKKISGGDEISINPKYHDPYNYLPLGQIVVTTNNAPVINERENALWRRPIIVKFDKQPYSVDEYNDIMEQIKTEEEIIKIISKSISYLPKNNEIKKKYHENINNQELYLENLEEPEWEFFDQFLDKSDGADFVVRKDIYEIFRIYNNTIGKKVPKVDRAFKTKIGKMLSGWCKMKRIQLTGKKKTVNGERVYVWVGLKWDTNSLKMFETELNPATDEGVSALLYVTSVRKEEELTYSSP